MKKRALALALTLTLCLGLVPATRAAGTSFTDVPESHWAYADVEAAASAGLMNGTGNGGFSPDMKVSAAQFLTLVGRVVFPDVKAEGADWYGPYVSVAQNMGLLDGTMVDVDDLGAEIARYDMAAILQAAAKVMGVSDKTASQSDVADYLDIPSRYTQAVLAVCGMGLIKGDQAGNFNGSNTMMRSEVATVIMRLVKAKPSDNTTEPTPTPKPTPQPEQTGTSTFGGGSGGGTSGGTGGSTNKSEPDFEGARKAIIQGLTEMRERMIDTTPYNIQQDNLRTLVDEILDEDPDRYFVFAIFWGPYNANDRKSTGVGFRYHGTKEKYDQYKEDMKEARAKAEEIVATTVHEGMSDYEIAKALHDYLVLDVEYDHNWIADIYDPNVKSGPINYILHPTLIEHKAVCGGYAYTYKYLMDLAGVPCEEVTGDADGTDKFAAALGYRWGVSHDWNIVQIDGEWYHVDVTWDDLGGDQVRYDYFLKSDKAMKGHYDWEAPHPCTSTKYDDQADIMNKQWQEEKQAQQEAQWAAERTALMVDFMKRFNTLPYRSEEGLTGTDGLSDDELLSYLRDKVYFPMDQYTYEEMESIYFAAINSSDEQTFKLNEQFFANSYEDGQWYLVVWRNDIWREYERRHED